MPVFLCCKSLFMTARTNENRIQVSFVLAVNHSRLPIKTKTSHKRSSFCSVNHFSWPPERMEIAYKLHSFSRSRIPDCHKCLSFFAVNHRSWAQERMNVKSLRKERNKTWHWNKHRHKTYQETNTKNQTTLCKKSAPGNKNTCHVFCSFREFQIAISFLFWSLQKQQRNKT